MNKEKLESMSDYQLSCKVLEAKSDCEMMSQTMQLPHSTCIGRDYNGMVLLFDINNPSDMMPLVFGNKMNMLSTFDGWLAFSDDDTPIESEHKNPLRACAIVYLLIKG